MSELTGRSQADFLRGGHGLGKTIAADLARAGANVTLLGRDTAHLDSATRDPTESFDIEARALVCDVTDPDSVASASAAEVFGPAHVLVNNAGQARSMPFTETSLELWHRAIDVNLTGPFLCTQQVLPSMIEVGSGRIVNVASTAALRGYARLRVRLRDGASRPTPCARAIQKAECRIRQSNQSCRSRV